MLPYYLVIDNVTFIDGSGMSSLFSMQNIFGSPFGSHFC